MSTTLPPVPTRSALTRRPQPAARGPAPTVPPPPAVGRMAWAKVAVEYPLAAALLVLLSPVILIGMIAVRWGSRGPAVYTQRRVGRDGQVFVIYKLRTMYHECESLTGPRWSMPGDPRVTPVGHVLRTLHIDELPQLLNVLRGEMSLVGPRPERPEICRELRKLVPGYDRRHAVKPGITGYAQIHLPPDSGLRTVKNKLAYDRFYLLKSGPVMELSIYACTTLKLLGLRRLYQRPPRRPSEN